MFRDDFITMRDPNRPSPAAAWSRSQDKLFEQALVVFPDETPDRWAKIAAQVPGKSAWEVREHYEALLHDVSEIDSGRIEVPRYAGESSWVEDRTAPGQSQISFGGAGRGKAAEGAAERKKGVPWTEEEHRLFLIGLQKYGRGDWRSISRNAVVSRTPTQVASHAQKYYLRLNSVKKEKKRSSIHDITTINGVPAPQPSESWGSPSAAAAGPHPDMAGQSQHADSAFVGHSSGQGSYGYQRFGYPM